MSKHRTQVERVVAAARSYRGITQVDFLAPNVIDGKDPITRVGARLWDAEQEGYSFECLGRRDKCKVFRLCGEPDVERAGSSPDPSPGARRLHAPAASSLDAGVEGDRGGQPDGGACLSSASASGATQPAVALSSGRLFDMKPERVGHYDEAKAA